MDSRIVIGPDYSIEIRSRSEGPMTVHPQPDFLLVCDLSSNIEALPGKSIFLYDPNQPFDPTSAIKGARRDLKIFLLRIDPALLIETAARLKMYRTGSHLSFREAGRPVRDSRLTAVCESIALEIENPDAGWREVISSQVRQMAVYLLRSHINVERSDLIELSRVGMVDRRLRLAIEFMHDNCHRELSLAEIAAAAYLSEFHFSRLFKKITGTTPSSYLAALRIERARRLLAETDLPITEVGARVGYSSQSHFTKVFRQTTGFTPRTFRSSLQK
ncbi:MAG: helix-turn-helix transcriptional regulator [Acidobacteria bacterium]|nr:helix-turn-helix transcriptional regulator [Acidobacteriota bacterium]